MRKLAVTLFIMIMSSLFLMNISNSDFPPAPEGAYSPWGDLNDDGAIDIFDIVWLASRYGTTGTPLNVTELLLGLETRVDLLNASVLSLEEQVALLGQGGCVVEGGEFDGEVNADMVEDAGANTVINFDRVFTSVEKPEMIISVILKQAANGLTEGSAIRAVEDVKGVAGAWTGFDLTVSKYSDGSSISDTTQVYITWIAIGVESTGSSENIANYYASTETYMTIGTGSVTITFPSGMFASAPNMSATGLVLSGSNTGKPLHFADITISTDAATFDLQYWDGATWQDVGSGVFVQLSLTAVEVSMSWVVALDADTVNTSTDTTGNVYISYPVGMFSATPQHLAVTAQFNSGGIAQMGHVTVSSHDQFGFWLNVKDGSGSNWSGNVQISYVAIQKSE